MEEEPLPRVAVPLNRRRHPGRDLPLVVADDRLEEPRLAVEVVVVRRG